MKKTNGLTKADIDRLGPNAREQVMQQLRELATPPKPRSVKESKPMNQPPKIKVQPRVEAKRQAKQPGKLFIPMTLVLMLLAIWYTLATHLH